MHAAVSGLVDKVIGAIETIASHSPVIKQEKKSFKEKMFPTSIRFLYLKSKKDQNKVVTIGYYYETPSIVCYQHASTRREKWDFGCQDTFNRKIGRDIVAGRFKKYEPKRMNVLSKDDMYNKFIYTYHPDRAERRKAKKALINQVFVEAANDE